MRGDFSCGNADYSEEYNSVKDIGVLRVKVNMISGQIIRVFSL